jgi:hypothetical protein
MEFLALLNHPEFLKYNAKLRHAPKRNLLNSAPGSAQLEIDSITMPVSMPE